jgi:predicted nucleotidyltransferase
MDLEEVGGAQRRRVEAANQLAKSGNRSYAPLVRRSEVTRLLSSHQDELDRLGVTSLLVFGSVARDEAGPDSDVDLIAEFNHSVGYLELSRVQRELEKFLGCRVVR